MSTQHVLYIDGIYVDRRYLDPRRTVRLRDRRRADRIQLVIVLCALALATFASYELNRLALSLAR